MRGPRVPGGGGRDASERKGPQRRPRRRLGRRLEEVAEAVGGGYCRLQMPLNLVLGVRGTVAGHRLGTVPPPPPFPMHPSRGGGAGAAEGALMKGPDGLCCVSRASGGGRRWDRPPTASGTDGRPLRRRSGLPRPARGPGQRPLSQGA